MKLLFVDARGEGKNRSYQLICRQVMELCRISPIPWMKNVVSSFRASARCLFFARGLEGAVLKAGRPPWPRGTCREQGEAILAVSETPIPKCSQHLGGAILWLHWMRL